MLVLMILSGETTMHSMLLRWFGSIVFACLAIAPVIAGEADSPALTYSPWAKFCLSDTCFVGRDGRLNVVSVDDRTNVDCGPVVSAMLMARSGDDKKTLRVTLPTRASPERGVRITIDQGQPIERPFMNCFANGCTAEYVAGPELVDQLKQGRRLFLEATDKSNSPIKLTVPLIGFADAYDGAAQEQKVSERVFSKEEAQASSEQNRRLAEDRKVWCPAR